MTDRLKQIWSGFEGVTERHLTGRGVENILRPERRDYSADTSSAIPEGVDAPAQAAFETLKTRLASQEYKAEKKKRGRKGRKAETKSFNVDTDIASAPESARDMLIGLKATEDRTQRSNASYVSVMSSEAGRELDSLKKRKKFLGIF